ncbi:MAG: zinc ribbon domain-containing protein [Acidobacteria bacterium]|nr:zinc ribbon domain-containing protein [Acidobacteriota bacterium]
MSAGGCPKCGFPGPVSAECPRCGVLVDRYRERREALEAGTLASPSSREALAARARSNLPSRVWRRLNAEDGEIDPIFFGGRLLVFTVFTLWGLVFIVTPMETNYVGSSFWHLVNLVFHEAGHLVFAPFGSFMKVLGGTLMQILVPVVCTGAFIWYRNPFAASISLWWTAQNFMDAAPYINDARAQRLMLLGGVTGREVPGYHDWQNILGRLGWLEYDHAIAAAFYAFGIVGMLAGLAWGGWVLSRQFARLRALRASGPP